MEVSFKLTEYAKTLSGAESFCVRAYAEALEIVPATLAENAGLNPISIVTELRQKHARGEQYAGVNVRKVRSALCIAPGHTWFNSGSCFGLDFEIQLTGIIDVLLICRGQSAICMMKMWYSLFWSAPVLSTSLLSVSG